MKLAKVESTTGDSSENGSRLPSDILDVSAAHLVFGYLAHHGYLSTAMAFLTQWLGNNNVMDNKNNTSSLGEHLSPVELRALQTLEYRQHVTKLIGEGRMLEGIQYIEEYFPHIISPDGMRDGEDVDPEWLRFTLLCQHFVETVRVGSATDALQFTEDVLNPLAMGKPRLLSHLQELVVLLAYSTPSESPVKHLLTLSQRNVLAEQVNAAILSTFQYEYLF